MKAWAQRFFGRFDLITGEFIKTFVCHQKFKTNPYFGEPKLIADKILPEYIQIAYSTSKPGTFNADYVVVKTIDYSQQL